ncbi:hypothetical protein OC835_002934 [Tilletia horrida]|nr:hypothetical protein OC835_002934 [Tilletia horrida]
MPPDLANQVVERLPLSASVQRCFDLPEILHLLLSYLSRERVDLLTFGQACRSLRRSTLQVWARDLDLPVTAAARRLKLFRAHPELLSHVRYMRIRNDLADNYLFASSARDAEKNKKRRVPAGWTSLNKLLRMLSAASEHSANLPLIDITVRPQDPLHLPPLLKSQVVALRILPTTNFYASFQMLASDDERMASSEEEDEQDDPSLDWKQAQQRGWEELASIACSARSLLVVHFGTRYDEVRALSNESHVRLWDAIAERQESSLRDLSVNLGTSDLPEAIFSTTTTLKRLQVLCLQHKGFRQVKDLDDFLDRHLHLRELSLESGDLPEPLSHRQTFRHLFCLNLPGPYQPSDDWVHFSRRHEGVLAVAKAQMIPKIQDSESTSSNSSLPYPNLRTCVSLQFMLDYDIDDFKELTHRGYRLADVSLRLIDRMDGTYEDMVTMLKHVGQDHAAAQVITSLEIEQDCGSLSVSLPEWGCSEIPPLLSSAALPNLVELSFRFDDSDEGDTAYTELCLARVMSMLVGASSLRVLQIEQGCRPFRRTLDILVGQTFPPAFEYFVWLVVPPQHFRFISSHPGGGIVKDASGQGKVGRLSPVPSTFRTHITPEGVWDRAFDTGRMSHVLDHLRGGRPALRRDHQSIFA